MINSYRRELHGSRLTNPARAGRQQRSLNSLGDASFPVYLTVANLSLYRKYRSQSFDELIGQDHVVKALKNGLKSNRINHAFLFTGPRGTGKTSTARLLAKCLCAEGGPTADPKPNDPNSELIATSSHPDVVEMDAASESGVDDIRTAIVEAVNYVPMMAKYKVYIIDEVHDLSSKAFDALLKTIEEPPEHVVFVLATTEYQKVPPTIRSRCQKFEFHRGKLSDISARLSYVCDQEGVKVEPPALDAIARMADGGFRDALSLLEQVMITAEGEVTLAQVEDQLGLVNEETVDGLLEAIINHNSKEIVKNLDTAASAGRDPRSVLESMMHRLSDLSRVACGLEEEGSNDAPRQAVLKEKSARLGLDRMIALRAVAAEAHREIRDVTLPRIWLESVILGWAQVPSGVKNSAEAERVSNREASAANSGAPKVAATPASTPTAGPQSPPVEPESKVAAKSQPESKAKGADGSKPNHAAVSEKSQPEDQANAGTVEDQNLESSSPTGSQESAVKQAWAKTVSAIEARSHQVKLENSTVAGETADSLTVQLAQESYVSWYEADERRIDYLEKQFAQQFGTRLKLQLKSNGKAPKPSSSEAVELTLDGEALYKKARSIFTP